MYNHASKDYICPFCLLVQGVENEHNSIKRTDLVYQDDQVTSFIGIQKWPNNVGHVLTIPNEHFENIYDLPWDQRFRKLDQAGKDLDWGNPGEMGG